MRTADECHAHPFEFMHEKVNLYESGIERYTVREACERHIQAKDFIAQSRPMNYISI